MKTSSTRFLGFHLFCIRVAEGMRMPRLFLVPLCALTLLAQTAPESLRIVVVEGQGAINNIRDHTARQPVVRVEDASERPIAGATVNFTLPDLGASAFFSDGRTALSTVTDASGLAAVRGMRPNNVAGQFPIRVTASYQGQTASATILQTNVAPPAAARSGSKKKYIIAALVAAAAGGALAATRGGKSASATPTPTPGGTVITPGSPVIGPPH
jgi:hypothetical protein